MATFCLCEACDGRGDDDDLLWPARCEACGGSGLEPAEDPDWPMPPEIDGSAEA